MGKMMFRWSFRIYFAGLILLLLFCKGYAVGDAEITRNVTENGTTTLLCDVDKGSTGFAVIAWEDKNQETVAELRDSNQGLVNVKDSLKGRVTISYPEGNLILADINRNDRGYYKCVVIYQGLPHTGKWYLINVLVPPEKLQIKCSGILDGTPTEDCSIIKKDEIRSIQCEAVSNPAPTLVWNKQVDDCKPKRFGGTKQLGYGLKRMYGLSPVCQGTYCCQAHYDHDGTLYNPEVCIDIGNVVYAPTANPLRSSNNLWMIIISVAVIFILIIIACLCLCICCKRRRNSKLPCCVEILTCIDSDNRPRYGQRPKDLTIQVNDNGVESTALTPFLGPNHVAPTQSNVFTFVVNEAQDNPNVNRVKVTQDNDPTGDNCRTVEIYKNRESEYPLPNESVQPGLFRRALSNSDVSKIVYTETIDDQGKVKREIDIIKGHPKQESVDAEQDYLLQSTGISLSPTGATYSMNSMQRQLSKRPATASDTDIRRPVLQRQLTIERSRDNLLTRTLPKQKSVDIEEVD